MGHTRLGSIPTARKWAEIVAQLAEVEEGVVVNELQPSDIMVIAGQTLDAAETGFNKAINDTGLQYTFYLLTRLVLTSREENWERQLSRLGINISEDDSLLALTTEIHKAIDHHVSIHGRPTDISEMAQQAAGEAIATLAATKASTLFGAGRVELKTALKDLSTKKGFSKLGHKFFGRFMSNFLNFYLSRITATHVGGRKLQNVADLDRFNKNLQLHCDQTAKIVRDYCGEWYSKTQFKEGINLDNTSNFVAVAVKKLRAEMKRQRGET